MRKATRLAYRFSALLVFLSMSLLAMEIEYPYHATPEREQAILEGFTMVQPGMSIVQVKDILGEPDEVRDLYEPNKTATDPIGFTYWYLIQRLKESGSQAEKGEKLVRVSFGLNGKVSGVDKW